MNIQIKKKTLLSFTLVLLSLPVNAWAENMVKTYQLSKHFSVRLLDQTDTLNCRSGAGTNYPTVKKLNNYQNIKAIKMVNKNKPWFLTNLGCYIRASDKYLWNNFSKNPRSMLSSKNRSTKGALIYKGQYYVHLADIKDTLNCRSGAGTAHPIVKKLRNGYRLRATKFINKKYPWFFTDLGCYVSASAEYLIWGGFSEDPSSMCDWRHDPC